MKYILLITTIFVFASCEKYRDLKKNGDILGSQYITGRLFIADSISNKLSERPLGETDVYITTDTTSEESYLLSVKTDKDGYFIFKDLGKKVFYIFASASDTNKVVYYKREKISLEDSSVNNFKLILQPKQIAQNGIVYTVNAPDGSPLANADICLFNNWQDIKDDGCEGSTVNFVTNNYGKAAKMNLPPNKYVANITAVYGSATYTARDTFEMTLEGIRYRTITLYPKQTPVANSITYLVLDSLGGPVKDCNVCLFSSFVLANEECEGANISFKSSQEGIAEVKDVVKGNYVVIFKAATANMTLRARDTIQVTETSAIRDTIYLRP